MNVPQTSTLPLGPFGVAHIQNVRVGIPPQLNQFVAAYAIHVLTVSCQASPQSLGRNFFYANLCSNNFNNDVFNKTTELAFRIGWYYVVSGKFATLEMAMESAVGYACGALAAEFILNTPQLQQGMSPQNVESMRTHWNRFQNERSYFYSVTFNEIPATNMAMQTGMHTGMQTTVTNHAPVTTAGGHVVNGEWDIPTTTNTSSNVGTGSGPALSQASFVQPSNSKLNESEVVLDNNTPVFQVAPESKTQVIENPAPSNTQRKYLYEPSYGSKINYPEHILTVGGKHEMDAMKHSRAYFGQVEISAQQSLIGLSGATFKMAEDARSDTAPEVELTKEEIHLSMTLQDMIDYTRLEHRKLSKSTKKQQPIYRVLGVVMNPAPVTPDVAKHLSLLYKGDLRSLGQRLATVTDCKTPDRPTPAQHERLLATTLIDRTLGRMLNDFLARGLRIPARTSTFCDSVVPCLNHIETRFGSDYKVLSENFLNVVGTNLAKYSTPDFQTAVGENLSYDKDDGVLMVPVANSVTFINLTSEELDWKLTFKGSDIDPKVTPTLDQLCFTLREDKTRFGFQTTYDWLVTGDGETYLIYENPDIRGGYRIFPVSGLNINRLV